MPDAGHDNLRQFSSHLPLHAGAVRGWEQAAMPQGNRRERDVEHEGRFQPVSNMGSGRADGGVGVAIAPGGQIVTGGDSGDGFWADRWACFRALSWTWIPPGA